MTGGDALAALLNRVAAGDGEPAHFTERELAEWPAAAIAQLKAAGLLVKGSPADVVRCPGCEEDCAMPVETAKTASGKLRAFVVCDRREDVARVPILRDQLEQWTSSPERVADGLARLLGSRRSNDDRVGRRWEVGVLKGAKGSAHVVLGIDGGLRLAIAGHSLSVAEVLELGARGLTLDRRALTRCVDGPVGAAGDEESAAQRRERLLGRRNELKAAGVRNYNLVMAEEEGVTTTRIKQLLDAKPEAQPATIAAPMSLLGQLRNPIPQKNKPER